MKYSTTQRWRDPRRCFELFETYLNIHRDSHLCECNHMCRTRGRSSIIIPSGGNTCSAWAQLRDALSRIQALYLTPSGQQQLEVKIIGNMWDNRIARA